MNKIDSNEDINELTVNAIKKVIQVDKCGSSYESVKIRNTCIEFKLDSGSDVNILPYKNFLKIKPKPRISKSNYNIEAYRGY